jgi:hypothetical protein
MRGRAPVLVALAATLSACGAGSSSSSSDVYRLGPAKTCFEAANLETREDRFQGARRLRVYTEGLGGPAYITIIFSGDTSRFNGDETRGNVVISGPGTTDDVVTQCLLEAKQ